MSFGPTADTKQAMGGLGTAGNTAATNSANQIQQGQGLLNLGNRTVGQGMSTVQPGVNFFNSILNGNGAATSQLLQPSVDQIRGQTQQSLQTLSNLMPRGGGRSGTLFDISYSPQRAVQGLYNQARTSAASVLPQIGLQQAGVGLQQGGLGANLFGAGNQALNTGVSANANLADISQRQQQISNSLWGGLGKGLLGLATLPFGGGAMSGTLLGSLGGLFGKSQPSWATDG